MKVIGKAAVREAIIKRRNNEIRYEKMCANSAHLQKMWILTGGKRCDFNLNIVNLSKYRPKRMFD